MEKHFIHGQNALLYDAVFKYCMTNNIAVLLEFVKAFLKKDAKKLVLLPTTLGNSFHGGKIEYPDIIFIVDDCLLVSLDIQKKLTDELVERAIDYALNLRKALIKKGSSYSPKMQVKVFFILEKGILFPKVTSPITVIHPLKSPKQNKSVEVSFLCLKKLAKGAYLLPCIQREWSLYLNGELDGTKSKVKGIQFMEDSFMAYPDNGIKMALRSRFLDELEVSRKEGVSIGVVEGKVIGENETNRKIVQNMKCQNVPITDIASYTGLPLVKVKQYY